MWLYKQNTGELFHDGQFIARGWAGQKQGYNNPAMQDVADIGPLPCGYYEIGPAYDHPKLGEVTMDLKPSPNNAMFGRADFRIHGAAYVNPSLSSEGCIIQMRIIRERIDASPDRLLQVISGL